MTRLFLAISVLSVLVACTTTSESGPQATSTIEEEANPAAPPRPTQIERMGFVVPIPTEWEEVKNERALQLTGEHGAAIANPNIMAVAEGNFTPASIVIRPVTQMDTDPKDPVKCQQTAEAFARALQSTVTSATIINLPATGETCQVNLKNNANPHLLTRITIMAADNNNYVLTCYYDARDASAANTCDQTLQAFTFKEIAAPQMDMSGDGGTTMSTGTDGGTSSGTDGGMSADGGQQ